MIHVKNIGTKIALLALGIIILLGMFILIIPEITDVNYAYVSYSGGLEIMEVKPGTVEISGGVREIVIFLDDYDFGTIYFYYTPYLETGPEENGGYPTVHFRNAEGHDSNFMLMPDSGEIIIISDWKFNEGEEKDIMAKLIVIMVMDMIDSTEEELEELLQQELQLFHNAQPIHNAI